MGLLPKVGQVFVPGDWVWQLCSIPQANMVILGRKGSPNRIQAIHLSEGTQVWDLKGEVLQKQIDPRGLSCDIEGMLYVGDHDNGRVLLVNGHTGEVIQELLQDEGLDWTWKVCCLNSTNQLLLEHPSGIALYNITSL